MTRNRTAAALAAATLTFCLAGSTAHAAVDGAGGVARTGGNLEYPDTNSGESVAPITKTPGTPPGGPPASTPGTPGTPGPPPTPEFAVVVRPDGTVAWGNCTPGIDAGCGSWRITPNIDPTNPNETCIDGGNGNIISGGGTVRICRPGTPAATDQGPIGFFGYDGVPVCIDTFIIERQPGGQTNVAPLGCSGLDTATISAACDSGASNVRVGFTIKATRPAANLDWVGPAPTLNPGPYWGEWASSVLTCASAESAPPTAVTWSVNGDAPKGWSGDGTPNDIALRYQIVGGAIATATFNGFTSLNADNYPGEYYSFTPGTGARFTMRFFAPSDSDQAAQSRGPYEVAAAGTYTVRWWKNVQTITAASSCSTSTNYVWTRPVVGSVYRYSNPITNVSSVRNFRFGTEPGGQYWTRLGPWRALTQVPIRNISPTTCGTRTVSAIRTEPGGVLTLPANIMLPVEVTKPKIAG